MQKNWIPAVSALFLGLIAQPAIAQETGFTCSNADFEIVCASGECQATETHTPMSISLTDTALSVCAYSGCWEGAPDAVVRTGPFVTYAASNLAHSSSVDGGADISITVDTMIGAATVQVSNIFTTPAWCERADP